MFLSDSSLPEMWSLSSGPLTSLNGKFFLCPLFCSFSESVHLEENTAYLLLVGLDVILAPKFSKHKDFF